MHNYNELIYNTVDFTINALNSEKDNVLRFLEENSNTSSIRALQMINLQKTIIATGMFALFDAELQRQLNCRDGFKEVSKLLESKANKNLNSRFRYFRMAINVLKHGKGKSYEILLAERDNLPFTIISDEDSFFFEGDIDEVPVLIKVDDNFLRNCAELINDVSKVIEMTHM